MVKGVSSENDQAGGGRNEVYRGHLRAGEHLQAVRPAGRTKRKKAAHRSGPPHLHQIVRS